MQHMYCRNFNCCCFVTIKLDIININRTHMSISRHLVINITRTIDVDYFNSPSIFNESLY